MYLRTVENSDALRERLDRGGSIRERASHDYRRLADPDVPIVGLIAARQGGVA
jgi:hypothetical protein